MKFDYIISILYTAYIIRCSCVLLVLRVHVFIHRLLGNNILHSKCISLFSKFYLFKYLCFCLCCLCICFITSCWREKRTPRSLYKSHLWSLLITLNFLPTYNFKCSCLCALLMLVSLSFRGAFSHSITSCNGNIAFVWRPTSPFPGIFGDLTSVWAFSGWLCSVRHKTTGSTVSRAPKFGCQLMTGGRDTAESVNRFSPSSHP